MNTDTDIEVQDLQTIETTLRVESCDEETASSDLTSAVGFTANSASAFLVS